MTFLPNPAKIFNIFSGDFLLPYTFSTDFKIYYIKLSSIYKKFKKFPQGTDLTASFPLQFISLISKQDIDQCHVFAEKKHQRKGNIENVKSRLQYIHIL